MSEALTLTSHDQERESLFVDDAQEAVLLAFKSQTRGVFGSHGNPNKTERQ
jgi:hypothetical protein